MPQEHVNEQFLVCSNPKCRYVLPTWDVSPLVREAHKHCGEFVPIAAAEVHAMYSKPTGEG